MFVWIYLMISFVITFMNAMPGFMPATWTVLAFFYIHYHLHLIPLVVIGALSATAGRIILALFSGRFLHRFLPSKIKNNYSDLGNLFNHYQKFTVPVMFGYAFLPIPSTQVFMAAGLANINLSLLSLSFLFGRLFSYSIWVKTANFAMNNFQSIFSNINQTEAIILNIISFSFIFLIGMIPWNKVIEKIENK